jgi:hypothetical protein
MKNPYRGGKVHKRARFGDISVKDTVKERQTRLGGSNSLAARQKRQLPWVQYTAWSCAPSDEALSISFERSSA